MATWPAYAKLRLTGLSLARKAAVTRSDMEIGPPKQITTAGRVMVARSAQVWFKTLADYNSFIVWFRDTIHRGQDWFDWTDPVTATTKQARIIGGLLESETPQNKALTEWVISLKLETWDDA